MAIFLISWGTVGCAADDICLHPFMMSVLKLAIFFVGRLAVYDDVVVGVGFNFYGCNVVTFRDNSHEMLQHVAA